MMKIRSALLVVVVCAGLFLLASCILPPAEPARFGEVPWQNGEVTMYDVVGADESLIGTAEWIIRYEEGAWTQVSTLQINGRVNTDTVVMAEDLAPLSTVKQSEDSLIEAIYTAEEVQIKTTSADGQTKTQTIQRAVDGWDNDQLLMLHRALPFAKGYSAGYTDIIPSTGAQMPVGITIIGQEEISVPAGVLNTWHLVMSFSSAKHDAWYAVEPPYLMVQYRNQGSGVEFRLRSWQPGEGQPVQGNQQSAVVPEPQPAATEMPQVNWLLLGLIGFVQLPLMLAFPIGLGWWLRNRFSQSWQLFFAGAVVFMASQIVHLPLNWALGLLGGSRGVALLPLPLIALIAGLSAGICEEGARWVALRFFLRKSRGWKPALQIGAGHGGIEAILLAALAFWGLINILLVQSVGVEALGLTGNTASQALGTVKAYWSVAWYLPLFAGLERLFAISAHIFMTVLVMRSFTHRNLGYLLAAIGFHTLLDAWAVWGMQMFHTVWVELGVGVLALFSLWMVLRLRDAEQPAPAGKADDIQ